MPDAIRNMLLFKMQELGAICRVRMAQQERSRLHEVRRECVPYPFPGRLREEYVPVFPGAMQ